MSCQFRKKHSCIFKSPNYLKQKAWNICEFELVLKKNRQISRKKKVLHIYEFKYILEKKKTSYPNCPNNCPPPPPSPKKFPCFHEGGGGNYLEFSWIFTFFDSRHFQMSSSELKLYFITYYRPLVYFEVFSIYLSVFYEFMWSPKKKQKKNYFGFFGFLNFFFLVFARGGGNYLDKSGNTVFTNSKKIPPYLFLQLN